MNCLLYARVSTDKQAQRELSIPAQIEMMTQYACRNGWKIIGQFVDRGESAKTADRPELQRLIRHCQENKSVDVVLVHKMDRLARNVFDHATIKLMLKRNKIRLISVSEPLDDNPIGQFMEYIIAGAAEYYSANLASEIRKGNMAKLQKGEWPTKPPVGYKSVPGDNNRVAHVPDERMAPLVRQAFELFSTGNYSLQALSEELFHRGLTTRHERMYSKQNIKLLLTRGFYIGRIVWQGTTYAGKHEPIIGKDLFYRVQEILKNRSTDTGEKGRLEFLLRGVAYCGTCGRRLTGEIHPRGSYYRCLPDINRSRCHERYAPVKTLDDQLEMLYRQMQPPIGFLELLKAEMHEISQRRQRLAVRQLGALRHTIADIEQKELRLLDEMLAGRVLHTTYEKMATTYTTKKQQAEARLAQLDVNYADPLEFLDNCAAVAGMLASLHHRFTFDQRKNLIRAVFRRIEVEDRQIVGVELNPPFSFFFDDAGCRLFKNRPTLPTRQDCFEQIVRFTISDEYAHANDRIKTLMVTAKQHCVSIEQAT